MNNNSPLANDMNCPELAILIKTSNRKDCIVNLLNSIEMFLTDIEFRIYIVDELQEDDEVLLKYETLRNHGHFILNSVVKMSVNVARNLMLGYLGDEKFILRLDDDFEFTKNTNINALVDILNTDEKIGVVSQNEIQVGNGKGTKSGDANKWIGQMLLIKPFLFKYFTDPGNSFSYYSKSGFRYQKFSLVRNFLLIRRGLIDKLKWDERFTFYFEHEDFLLSVSNLGYEIAHCSVSSHLHRDDLSYKYKKISSNAKFPVLRHYFSVLPLFEKWGVMFVLPTEHFSLNTKLLIKTVVLSSLSKYLRKCAKYYKTII